MGGRAQGRKDDLRSYKVRCDSCGAESPLIFFDCSHNDPKNGLYAPELVSKKNRGLPVRSSAATNPLVITFPDIPKTGELDSGGHRGSRGRLRSEVFKILFPEKEESVLYSSKMAECLRSSDFLERKSIQLRCELLGLSTTDPKSVDAIDESSDCLSCS